MIANIDTTTHRMKEKPAFNRNARFRVPKTV